MSRSRLRRGAALLLAASMVFAACGDDDDDEATAGDETEEESNGDEEEEPAETVTFAFFGAQTGDNANLGINISNGIKLAFDEANDAGDLGFTLKLKIFDTQGTPEQAGTLKDQVVSDDAIVGVIGPAFSGESKAANPTFDQAGLPIITPSATNPDLSKQGWKVFHRLLGNDQTQGEETAKYISKGLKAASVAYVHDNTEYGKGLVEVVKGTAEGLGVKTALFDAVDPKGTDYSAAVNKVKASKAPVVYYSGYYNEAGRFAKQLRDAGVTGTFLSGDGSKDPGFIEVGGPASENAELTCPCADPSVSEDPASIAFTEAYTEAFKKAPGTYSAEAYDAANLFIEAVRKGNTTRADILTFLNDELETFKGITKEISFTEEGELTSGSVYVFLVKDGKITVKGTTEELSAG